MQGWQDVLLQGGDHQGSVPVCVEVQGCSGQNTTTGHGGANVNTALESVITKAEAEEQVKMAQDKLIMEMKPEVSNERQER